MRPDDALDQVEYLRQLTQRTREHASVFAPDLAWWGGAWSIGYLASVWVPWVWSALIPLALVGHWLLRWRIGRGMAPPSPLMVRILVADAVLFGAIFLLPLVILAGSEWTPNQVGAYYPFMFGVMYAVNGAFLGRELLAIGGWLVLAASASLAMPVTVALVWLAVAGGGGMVLAGVVLHRFAHPRPRRRRHLEAV